MGLEYGVIFGRENAAEARDPHKSWTVDGAATMAALNVVV